MQNIRRLGLVAIVVFLTIGAAGCVLFSGAAIGPDTYSYVSGNLKTTYAATLPRAWEATDRALAYLGLVTIDQKRDAFFGRFDGEMADGRDFTVSLTKITDNTTEIGVRIDLGDRSVSETIHAEIANILKR